MHYDELFESLQNEYAKHAAAAMAQKIDEEVMKAVLRPPAY